jgi:hypothetical protein
LKTELSTERQQELIQALTEIVEELGWIIGIPIVESEEDNVHGLIVGTEQFVMDAVESTGMEVEKIESIEDSNDKKNKTNLH